MNKTDFLEHLLYEVPPHVEAMLDAAPLAFESISLRPDDVLLGIDQVKGFCSAGHGPLAPPVESPRIERMNALTVLLAQAVEKKIFTRDVHRPDQIEYPYPAHCVVGSGDEDFVDELAFLESDPNAVILQKDCINSVIGGIRPDGTNAFIDAINSQGAKRLIVVGICTDICVINPLIALISAVNRGLMPNLEKIVVFEPGLATYDLPLDVAKSIGLPDAAAHPAAQFHVSALQIMQNQGIGIVSEITLPDGSLLRG